ncbi:HNH endonuclease [Pseudomonas sp. W5-01]|uniref:HNH endonuclease n=1 Tax=Pseudomonas sp. W5-01 TaxID=3097454 RepID=UPI00397A45A4
MRDQYTCQSCGTVTLDLEVDHIINIAQGGSDDDANLQALCVPCHKVKTAQESAHGAGRS